MKKVFAIALPVLLALAVAAPASAIQTITPGTDGVERISGGVFELGLDNMLLVRFDSTGEDPDTSSTLQATYLGGITPRYFLFDNFSLGANLEVFIGKRTDKATVAGVETERSWFDIGFLGMIEANYYLRLGWGMFFAPGVGAGGFYGQRSIPAGAGLSSDRGLYGGAVKLDLGFVFYAGPHFNIKGGPDILLRFGKEAPEGVDAQSFLAIEAAFHLGLAYSI
jgi:hypothetical protein